MIARWILSAGTSFTVAEVSREITARSAITRMGVSGGREKGQWLK